MSGASSSVAKSFSLLDRAIIEPSLTRRPDDPRLGEIIETWDGVESAFRRGRAVIVGFPQDEGVRRNGGRVGAQPFAVAKEHLRYLQQRGGRVYWASHEFRATHFLLEETDFMKRDHCHVMLTIDADAFTAADVPGVSAPNPFGLPGSEVAPL